MNNVTEVGVALNKGFGLGDTLVYIPLFISGIVGILRKTSIGLFAMLGAMAITIYWPIVALSTLYFANGGMADNHLNIAVASDGTLYAAVKTSYDSVGYPLVALLVRQITGKGDELKIVDDEGSRGIVLLNENEDKVIVCYTSYRDNKIVYRISSTNSISFGKRQSLIEGWKNINNVTSTKQNITNVVVILASESGIARGVKLLWHSAE